MKDKGLNEGRKGGLLKGDAHSDPSGGINAVVTDSNDKPVLLEGEEVIINKKAVNAPGEKTLKGTNKEILHQINTSTGGKPILKEGGHVDESDADEIKKTWQSLRDKICRKLVDINDKSQWRWFDRLTITKEWDKPMLKHAKIQINLVKEQMKKGGGLTPYEQRLAKWQIEENPDAPNYVKAIDWAKKHGYHLSNDVSYNGYIFFEKVICNGEHKIKLQVYDDIIKSSAPGFEQYDLEADFGQSIMDETKHRFKMASNQSDWDANNLDDLFALALRKEKHLEKDCPDKKARGGSAVEKPKSVKELLLQDGDNENDYIVEGTRLTTGEGPAEDQWEIISLTTENITVKHLPKSSLGSSAGERTITYEQLRDDFSKNSIKINGINSGDTRCLNLCIKAIKQALGQESFAKGGGISFTSSSYEAGECANIMPAIEHGATVSKRKDGTKGYDINFNSQEELDAYLKALKEMDGSHVEMGEGGPVGDFRKSLKPHNYDAPGYNPFKIPIYENDKDNVFVFRSDIEPIWVEQNKKRDKLNKEAAKKKKEFESLDNRKRPKSNKAWIVLNNKVRAAEDAYKKAQSEAESTGTTVAYITPRAMSLVYNEDGSSVNNADLQSELMDKYKSIYMEDGGAVSSINIDNDIAATKILIESADYDENGNPIDREYVNGLQDHLDALEILKNTK